MAWGKNGTPSTLTGAGDTITISDLTAKQFEVVLIHTLTSGATYPVLSFNNNGNTVYAMRYSQNGAADGTGVSTSNYDFGIQPNADEFIVVYICDISGQEKLGISSLLSTLTGAGTAPIRLEAVIKFVPSPNVTITRVDITNSGAGDFVTGSNISAIGTD